MRGMLYKNAFSRINLAMEQGFHLEAISLIESLVSDRLESRLSFLKQKDFSFEPLGSLIKEIGRIKKTTGSRNLSAMILIHGA